MSESRKKVVVFRKLPDDLLERIRAQHDVTVADPRRPDELPRFRAALHDAQGLIGSSFKLTADDLASAPALEVVSSISVGIDNYDLSYLKQRGIVLCHTPGVLTETTADTVFALVMATSRRLIELSALVRERHCSTRSTAAICALRASTSLRSSHCRRTRGCERTRR